MRAKKQIRDIVYSDVEYVIACTWAREELEAELHDARIKKGVFGDEDRRKDLQRRIDALKPLEIAKRCGDLNNYQVVSIINGNYPVWEVIAGRRLNKMREFASDQTPWTHKSNMDGRW